MTSSLAIARTILEGFDHHYRVFRATSIEAKARFERGDWRAMREATAARIDFYDLRVREAVARVGEIFPDAARSDELWPTIKTAYIGLLYEHKQPECAETFYNSVASRVLDRQYHRNEYIFSRPAISTEHIDGDEPAYRCYYPGVTDLRAAFVSILESFALANPFADLERDADRMMHVIAEAFPDGFPREPNFQLQVLRSLFFRNKAAYVMGRVLNGAETIAFVVPLLQDENKRLYVDALLLDKKSIGRLMSLGRSYFMVDMEVPAAYVAFLGSLVPSRPKADLYTMVGLQKQGKTLFFRDLGQHLKHSTDRFVLAPGTKGMVMLVFTLPSFPYVFKIIRDWFEPPKDLDRRVVEERYQLVKRHDRVARLTDTLEYTHVAFPRERFDDALLAELQRVARDGVEIDGDRVVIKHLYAEGRLVPLDVFLRSADEPKMKDAVRDFGDALKDLAAANVFPGDLLPKNFGVTRYGRIVFYDYDEICYLTDCRFRRLPTPRDDDDEMSAEPWFAVGPTDVFPEQFPTFLFPPGPQRDAFLAYHADLTDPRTWTARQEHIREGVEEDVFPYTQELRFRHRFGA